MCAKIGKKKWGFHVFSLPEREKAQICTPHQRRLFSQKPLGKPINRAFSETFTYLRMQNHIVLDVMFGRT
jgi:hypothetical protein